jgi:hypothetical protein
MPVFRVTGRDLLRSWLRRLPPAWRGRVRAGARRLPLVERLFVPAAARQRPPGTINWGDLRRPAPFSRDWGYDRGTPIDRVYIEQFLSRHAADVRGACLEVMNADYTRRFGGARVDRADVLDINPANTDATVVADLGEPDSLPRARYDCVVFTQTLHLVPDMGTALANVWRAVAPGGILLLTVPALGRHDPRKGFHHDRWRVTVTGLAWLLQRFDDAHAEITAYGNLLSCTAFLYGIAAAELTDDELNAADASFPLIVSARVVKARAQ